MTESGMPGVDSNERYFRQFLQEADPRLVSPVVFQNTVSSAAAGQVAILNGLRGLNLTLASGLTAGLQAVGYAADLIRWGRAEVVLAGGIEHPSPSLMECLDRLGLWKQPTDDWVSEGAGLVVLENPALKGRPPSLLDPPYVEVLGSGWAHGGRNGPNPHSPPAKEGGDPAHGLARAIRQALAQSGCEAQEVRQVYLAGSSSRFLEKAEEEALEQIFGKANASPAQRDLKAILGEPLGAWGGVALVASSLEGSEPEGISLINALDFDGNGACLVVRTVGRWPT